MKELETLAQMPGHNAPFLVVAGKAMTAKQALEWWRRGGQAKLDVEKSMQIRGIDDPPGEEIRVLALAYYQDLAARYPAMRIVLPIWGKPQVFSYQEIVQHLAKKDDVAVSICKMYALRLAEMQRIAQK